MRSFALVFAAGLGISLAYPAAQSIQNQTLTGTLSIRTKGATTAVFGKNADTKQGDFMFCVDQDRSTRQSIDFTGPGRVVYRPKPAPPIPAGIEVTGPEMVENTLAVVTDDGKAWLFVAEGQKAPLPAGDPALATATTVQVVTVRRTDWAARTGPRRGTSFEGCLAPGG
jgi:hypothetical protein